MVDFIKTQEKILGKPIKDLDDCRLAMSCLEIIRSNFIEMDLDLGLMEEAYAVFARYAIDVPKEDIERIDTLRFNFESMINHVSHLHTMAKQYTFIFDQFRRNLYKKIFAMYKGHY